MKRKGALIIVGGGCIVIMVLLGWHWDRLGALYHLHELRKGDGALREFLLAPTTRLRSLALASYLESDEGLRQLILLIVSEARRVGFPGPGRGLRKALLEFDGDGSLLWELTCDGSHSNMSYSGGDKQLFSGLRALMSKLRGPEAMFEPGVIGRFLPRAVAGPVIDRGNHLEDTPEEGTGPEAKEVVLVLLGSET